MLVGEVFNVAVKHLAIDTVEIVLDYVGCVDLHSVNNEVIVQHLAPLAVTRSHIETGRAFREVRDNPLDRFSLADFKTCHCRSPYPC